MCSIVGWYGYPPEESKLHLINKGTQRGRDGWGFSSNGLSLKGFGKVGLESYKKICSAKKLIGNFRATPTTEAESDIETLQPYGGIVHNGVIANDKDFGSFPIDSMCLPAIFENRSWKQLESNLDKIKGSYAIAYFENDDLILACNYKPIYYQATEEYIIFASTPEMILGDSIALPPYSAIRFNPTQTEKETIELKRSHNKKVVVSCSGGLDSVTVAYMLKEQGYEVTLAYFTYGCLAEERELERVNKIAKHGEFGITVLDMPRVMSGTIVEGNYHKDDVEGVEYAHDWVSARNLLMMAILTAYAEAQEIGNIAFGGNLEESGAYPDNEQEFGRKFNELLPYSVQNGVKIEFLQPLSTFMKHEIVKEGLKINVPFELTWSCYGGEEKHCGKCAPCFMRKTAFERNESKDPCQ